MTAATRPKQVKVATTCAALSLGVALASTIVYRSALGEGWAFYLFFQFFLAAIYSVFLIFAYNGRGWVRFFFVVLYLVAFGRAFSVDIRVALEPFTMLSALLSILAIGFWFSTASNRWYRDLGRTAT